MLFNWLNHADLQNHQKLMAVLYELSAATLEQLSVVTGWKEKTVRNYLEEIRKYYVELVPPDVSLSSLPKDEIQIKKARYLKTIPLQKKASKVIVKAYSLGSKSMEMMHQLRQESGRIRDEIGIQAAHYVGIGDILVRILLSGADRNRMQWYNTTDATFTLIRFLRAAGLESLDANGKKISREVIRPDALFTIDEGAGGLYWLEYDNQTENPRQLERKFNLYVKTLRPAPGEEIPGEVVWVAPTEKRKTYLQKTWDYIIDYQFKELPVPKMHFFVAGEELPLLANKIQKPVSTAPKLRLHYPKNE